MSEARWKATERRVATELNGRRIPVSGRAGRPDVDHRWLAPEVKSRKELPGWLLEAMRQAQGSAGPSQLPVVILHRVGDRYQHGLVVLTMQDFRDWFGDDPVRWEEAAP